MGGCVSVEEIAPRNPLIIDVQQILADDAWNEFVMTSYRNCRHWRRRRRMKRSDYIIEVPMNYYHFEVTKQEFKSRLNLPSQRSNDSNAAKQSTSQALAERASPDQLGLKTEFKNDTDQDQTYNFRMEKKRTATVEVSYQKGFSIGGSANFSLGLPKVLEGGGLSAEISSTYEVTSSKGQSFEETLTTEATSQIVVSKNTHCTAQVVMQERRLLADFTVWVTMYMPEKSAVVQIKNSEGRLVFLKEIVNLYLLFPLETHILENGEKRPDALQFIIHGFVDGMQLSNHYIHLKSHKLPTTGGKTSKRRPGPPGDSGDTSPPKDDDDTEFPDLQDMGLKRGF